MKSAIFLDRDGTLNIEDGYLTSPDNLRLFPGAAEAVLRLQNAGYTVVVVTNQSAIAREFITEAELQNIHTELKRQLAHSGATLDGIYYCPHHPDVGTPPYRSACQCRKPNPGLLLQAARELDLDLKRSTIVGDSLSDLQAGWSAGSRAILVRTGHGEEVCSKTDPKTLDRITYIAPTLCDAADWIVSQPF